MRQIILLRGINLGPRRRVPMTDLRQCFDSEGYEDVRTYVQSGNVVLDSDVKPSTLERRTAKLISEQFGFDVPVVVRTRDELADVVKRNPHQKIVTEPKRYQVSFLSARLEPAVVTRLEQLATEDEALTVDGREIYAWHPAGVARSKLWNMLAGSGLGVTATARNWKTVLTLLEMADG